MTIIPQTERKGALGLVAALFLSLLILGPVVEAAETGSDAEEGVAFGSSSGRIDWSSSNEVRWDPERREFVVVERAEADAQEPTAAPRQARQQVRWDSLDQIRWDAESRSFVMTERSASSPEPDEFDARNYRLSVRDRIEFRVFDEPDLGMTQRIDGSGQVRIPLLGNHQIAGMSVREAEDYIEKLYVENRILRNPTVTILVDEYAPREVAVLGAVGTPGTQEFPIERNQMDIVEVISRAGGFTGIARSNQVAVTRVTENGRERTFTVNVESMITGSRRQDSDRFYVQPGDIIWVPERVF